MQLRNSAASRVCLHEADGAGGMQLVSFLLCICRSLNVTGVSSCCITCVASRTWDMHRSAGMQVGRNAACCKHGQAAAHVVAGWLLGGALG